MSEITFSKEEREILIRKLKTYFEEELDQDLGQFECEFLLDFISAEIGACYYNRGIMDAQALLASRIDDITEAFHELEKPVAI